MIYAKLSALRALTVLAAKDDIRYYLNGVLIEYSPTITRIVATNGHVMGVYNDTQENEGFGSFIIPRSALDLLKPANKLDQVCITREGTGSGSISVIGGASVNFTPVDGKFPDYVRVIPDKVTGEVAQFNPDYIADFKKVYKLLGAKTFHIHHNGHGGAVMDFDLANFLGVMMPLRSSVSLESYNPAAFKTPI